MCKCGCLLSVVSVELARNAVEMVLNNYGSNSDEDLS